MRIVLIGAGMQAQAIAHDIVKNRRLEKLVIGDQDLGRARALVRRLGSGKARAMELDATKGLQVKKAITGAHCVIGATTYSHNERLTKASVRAGAHFCDLGGNVDVVNAQHRLSPAAKKAGVTIIPDCGLAPGLVNILGYHWAQPFTQVDHLAIRVGGLPQQPKTRLKYQLLFSVEGLINEYTEDALILRDGKRVRVPGMSGLESLRFPAPYGELEAFYTSGGISTLPSTLRGKVRNLDYKTIRYPGHATFVAFLKEVGLFSSDKLAVGRQGIVPRRLMGRLLTDYLPQGQPDVALVRIEIRGTRGGKREHLSFDGIDTYDPRTKLTAMQRTTGFPAAIIAQMLAAGCIQKTGTVPQELAIGGDAFLVELEKRRIRFRRRRRRLS